MKDAILHFGVAQVLVGAEGPGVLNQLIHHAVVDERDVLPHELGAHLLEVVQGQLATQIANYRVLVDQ